MIEDLTDDPRLEKDVRLIDTSLRDAFLSEPYRSEPCPMGWIAQILRVGEGEAWLVAFPGDCAILAAPVCFAPVDPQAMKTREDLQRQEDLEVVESANWKEQKSVTLRKIVVLLEQDMH